MANIPQAHDLRFQVIPGIPLINSGDALSTIVWNAIDVAGMQLVDGDVLVVAQKIVSKAEGRLIPLASVVPSQAARDLAAETDKDPALCQLILDESAVVMRKKAGVLIVRHRLGHVGANAGIDQSNIKHAHGDSALLLPVDPDRSAHDLRSGIGELSGRKIGVIVCDSMNRPWRLGSIGGAIGCAGLQILDDRRGGEDMYGRELKVTLVNRADSLAATATLMMGETTERTPAVLIRGLPPVESDETTRDMMRPIEDDLFA
ncbi:MAG: coenzyme F420-0:L-glutamate ligase/coenzyme F420-1:gamma-L-glutamate ligase [Gammaproteobacteria bacterium]|jgi:coenzyme F420-0:L-glutamate ligase/coenzyme F420-1:gamma-L-glutamate ligase